MNLFELQELRDSVKSDIRYYTNEKERLEISAGVKATRYDKEMITGHSGNSKETVLIMLAQMSSDLDDAIARLSNIDTLVSDKYNSYRKYNDYDKQIYVEKKLFKWSNEKISARHNGIGKSQIYNIVNKIEEVEKSGKHM